MATTDFGTLTLVKRIQVANGPLFMDHLTAVGPTSYPSNGVTTLVAAYQALTKDGSEILSVVGNEKNGYHLWWDHVNSKMVIMYSDLNGASDGPDIELPNTTDIHTTTLDFWVLAR